MKSLKFLVLIVAFLLPYIAKASTNCNLISSKCELFIDSAGNLIDSKHHVEIKDIDNSGMMAGAYTINYDNQYVIVKENFTYDHLAIIIPAIWNGKNLQFNTVYSIFIDTLKSEHQIKWSGKKSKGKFIKINSKLFDIADDICHSVKNYCADTTSDNIPNNEKFISGFPSVDFYIWTGKSENPEHCFVPFNNSDVGLDIASIACRKVFSMNGTMSFTGAMGKNIPIVMILTRKNDAITGKYMYPRNSKEWINLRGRISSRNKITLDELDGKTGAVSAIFSGTIKDGYIAGSWATVDKKKTFPFRMLQQGFSSN